MDIEVLSAEASSDVTIMRLSGRLDLAGADEVGPEILDALAKCQGGLVVDMSGVEFMSSAGLRTILIAREKAEEAGKALALLHVRPLIYKIFKIAALDKAFHFFEDEGKAVQALSS